MSHLETTAQRYAEAAVFAEMLGQPVTKQPITVLQINLGKHCNSVPTATSRRVPTAPKHYQKQSAIS